MTNGKDSAFAKSAFYHPDGGIDIPQEGLTKREYFAAIVSVDGVEFPNMEQAAKFAEIDLPDVYDFEAMLKVSIAVEAKLRVMKADALINALNKEQ